MLPFLQKPDSEDIQKPDKVKKNRNYLKELMVCGPAESILSFLNFSRRAALQRRCGGNLVPASVPNNQQFSL
jgi:hypothetical protein